MSQAGPGEGDKRSSLGCALKIGSPVVESREHSIKDNSVRGQGKRKDGVSVSEEQKQTFFLARQGVQGEEVHLPHTRCSWRRQQAQLGLGKSFRPE